MQLLTYGIASTFFFDTCAYLSDRVQSGTFDDSLTVPVKPLLYEIISNYNTGYIRHISLSIIIIIISFIRLNIIVTPIKILMLLIFIFGASLIHAGAYLILSAPNFWMIRGEKLLNLFYFNFTDFIRYPITIYPIILQGILTFILPYAFINFYPALYILEKNDFSVFHPVFQYMTPIIGITIFLLGILFWNRSLKKYESTGS